MFEFGTIPSFVVLETPAFKENKPVYYTNRAEVFRILKEAVINGTILENQISHQENIKDMLGKHRIFD